jgi:hypothetical protein
VSIVPISWECGCGGFNAVEDTTCRHCWKARYSSPGNYRFCVWCNADCEETDPEHDERCPQTTGLYLVTPGDLGVRGPDDPYAHGMCCMDCGHEFAAGDTYAKRPVSEDVLEIVCVGCRVLNPEGDDA